MSTIRDPAYITDAGRTMMTAGGDVTYTKAVLYGQDISHLTSDQVKALTTIGSPLREVKVGISDKQNTDRGTTVILEATFQNDNLANDLPYTAVGFFAQKGNDEKLIAVAVANTGAYLTATSPDGVATDALDLKLAIAIGDATNVTATVDPAGSVTPATLNGAINKATHDLTAQIATKADKTTVEQELAVKANSTDVDKKLDTKANFSDVYTKKQVDDAFSSRDATIATKADKATVDAEISKIDFTPYAKTADVNKEIKTVTDLANTKVDATYSYSKAELDKKLLALSTDTSGKVDANQVATMIEGKADKADLDKQIKAVSDEVATKVGADYSYSKAQLDEKLLALSTDTNGKVSADQVTALIADKANKADVDKQIKDINDAVATKADKATVDAEIAKIDFTPYAKSADVAKDLQGYTTTADLTKLLAGKRDIADSYSRAELDKKFLQLSTDTSGKVSADQIAKLLASKVDKTDLTSQLQAITDSIGTKANSANVTAELAKKDNTADVDAKIKTVTDLANTKANSSDVYTKSAIDTAFSQRDSRIANVTNLANQIDSTRLPLYQGSANEDLKGFFTPQIRMYNNATGVKNIPADCQYQSNFYGTLVVLPDGASNTNDGSQILITPERKAWIAQSNGQGAKSWSDWSRFTLTSDLSAVQSALQAKIDAKADASNVYSKSEVDSKTTATIVSGYDIPSKTKQTISAGVNVRWLVAPSVIDIVADQINQLKGRRTIDAPDFNSLTDGGSYYITNPQGGKNGPTGSWGNLFVSNGNGHRISQLYFPDDGSAPFMRELDESTWHNWIQLSTKSDVQNAVNLANSASNKIDTVLANSYVRKQGMNANGDCVEIKHTGIKQANGGYAFDMWSDDWTASKLQDVIKNQLPSKANTADVNNALNDKANAGDVSALQNKVNTTVPLFRRITAGATWNDILGTNNGSGVLVSIRDEGGTNTLGNFSAAIAFGGGDTKGVLNVGYSDHTARVIGGNGSSPVWHEDIAWKSDVTNLQNQVNTKASASDVNSLNQTISALQQTVADLKNTVNQQATQITGLRTLVNNQANEIKQLQETTIKGKTFSKLQEAAAEAWEKQNSQQVAFILDN